jgi:ketosteroid isomerase-like protein
MSTKSVEQRLQEVEDRIAIKAIVDTFSNLADKQEFAALVMLLTEDAEVDFYFGEALAGSWKGRAAFEAALVRFSGNFEATYHLNGQQVIELQGDIATSQHYCLAMQIAASEGKKQLTTNGVTYNDTYVRRPDGWKIAKRTSRFGWSDTAEMAAA